MKHLAVTVLLLCSVAFAFAQTVVVTSTEKSMSLGTHPALSVQVNGVDEDDVMKDLASHWKKNGARVDIKDDVLTATEYEPKEFRPTMFTLYGSTTADKNASMVYLWAYDGTQYINASHPAYKHFESELKSFGVAENRKPFEKQLKETERALEKSINERQSLERDRTNWQKDIDDCNKTITTTQHKLKDSESELSKDIERIAELERDTEKLKKQIDAIQ